MKGFPTVSVIIPAYNARDTIGKCLQSILDSHYPSDKLEVVVVDDSSTDETISIVSKYPVRLLKHDKNKGAAAARNTGVKMSSGEIVAFTDSDCIVDKDWVRELVKCYKDKNIGAVGGKYLPYNLDNLIVKFTYGRDLVTGISSLKDGENPVVLDGHLPSANLSFRRKVFIEVGGFDERFKSAAGEDRDICYRMMEKKYKLVYNPRAVVYHKHRQDLKSFLKQRYTYGFYREFVKEKYEWFKREESKSTLFFKLQRVIFIILLLFNLYLIFAISFFFISLFFLAPYLTYLPLAYRISRKVNDRRLIFLSPFLSIWGLIAWNLGKYHGKIKLKGCTKCSIGL
jgi:cellulose synthase/poly-beta-1,6-N-acetylglucosamine synthase-like glycosyltransferase